MNNKVWDALSDPTRRKILMLLKDGELTAGEISTEFEISKPSISHHLNVLKNANLIRSCRSGQNIIYILSTSVLEDVLLLINQLMKGKGK